MDAGPLAVYPVHESLRSKVGGEGGLLDAAAGGRGRCTPRELAVLCRLPCARFPPTRPVAPLRPPSLASPAP